MKLLVKVLLKKIRNYHVSKIIKESFSKFVDKKRTLLIPWNISLKYFNSIILRSFNHFPNVFIGDRLIQNFKYLWLYVNISYVSAISSEMCVHFLLSRHVSPFSLFLKNIILRPYPTYQYFLYFDIMGIHNLDIFPHEWIIH